MTLSVINLNVSKFRASLTIVTKICYYVQYLLHFWNRKMHGPLVQTDLFKTITLYHGFFCCLFVCLFCFVLFFGLFVCRFFVLLFVVFGLFGFFAFVLLFVVFCFVFVFFGLGLFCFVLFCFLGGGVVHV